MNNNPNINSSANNNNSSSSSSSNNNNNSSYPIVSKPQLSKMEDIGIDARLVNPNSGKALECAICYELLKFPRQCRNGHLFCQACIVKHLQRNQNSCPMCKIELKEQDLARSILAEDQINSLLVYCRYHFTLENALKQKQSTDNNGVGSDEQQSSPKTMTHNGMSVWVQDPEGCQHNDSFQSIGSHEIQCQFGWVDCSYSSVCCVRKRDIEQHLQSCPFRPWKCPYCQIPVEKQLFEKHTQNDCERFPLKCKLCQAEVPRSEMDFEHKSVCPEQLVPCVFVAEGCQIKQLKRCQLSDHLARDWIYHMELMRLDSDRKTAALVATLESQLKARDERIAKLESSVSGNEVTISWTIPEWTKKTKTEQYLQSQPFVFRDITWFLGLYPNGDNNNNNNNIQNNNNNNSNNNSDSNNTNDSNGYLSLFLFVDSESIPNGRTQVVEFTMRIVNHKSPNDSLKRVWRVRYPVASHHGWGARKVIATQSVSEQTGFLLNDKLHIEGHLLLKRLHYDLDTVSDDNIIVGKK